MIDQDRSYHTCNEYMNVYLHGDGDVEFTTEDSDGITSAYLNKVEVLDLIGYLQWTSNITG